MEPIYPLQEEHINHFCGNMVCVVTKEGQRHIGLLTSCRSGRIYLNEPPSSHGDRTYLQGKAKKKGSKTGKARAANAAEAEKAQTKVVSPYDGYAPYVPFGEAVSVDLAAIAYVFPLL